LRETAPLRFFSHLIPIALLVIPVLAACGDDASEPSRSDTDPDAGGNRSDAPLDVDSGSDASANGLLEAGPDGSSSEADASPVLADASAAATVEAVDGDVPVVKVALTVSPNPLNPLSVFVNWHTSSEGTATVRVQCDDDFGYELVGVAKRTDHRAYLQGFWAGAHCDVRVRSRLDGRLADSTASFEIGPLDVELPELVVEASNPDRVQPGWTLFDLTGVQVARPIRFVVVDELGRYRWFHLRAGSTQGASGNDARVLPEGVLLGGAGWVGVMPAIVRWDGELAWEGDINQHHDIRLFPDSNHFTFLSVDPDCPDVSSHRVSTIDRQTGEVTWDWRHCEHFLPTPPFEDWSHLNGVAPFPDGEALLISSRHQSALFKVNVESSEIEWMLGFPPTPYEPSDLPVLDMSVDDRFWRQHAPEIQDNGNILLFDNGSSDRPYSRVLEIAIDETERTAQRVWEYRHDPDVYAGQWGDADRLGNGNVLSVWGQLSGTEASRIVEVGSDGTLVWELKTPTDWGIYRANRITLEDMPHGYLY
jgi:hypothetical protein